MRILFTSTAFYPSIGGAQLHWHTISQKLAERGHELSVLSQWQHTSSRWLLESTLLAPSRNERYELGKVVVNQVQPTRSDRALMLPLLPLFFAIPELAVPPIARLFQRRLTKVTGEFDLVHNVRIGREHYSWASYYLARSRNVPFFITPNYSPRMRSGINRFLMRHFFKLLRLADGVLVFTDEEGDELAGLGVRRERLFRVSIGPLVVPDASPELFREAHKVSGPLVLFLGQKLPYKGFRELLEAARIVWQTHPDLHVALIGPHHAESRGLIESFDDPRVIDVPALKPLDPMKSSALAACTLMAVPSRQEGLGGVYLEAWHFGKPVIACEIPFVREIVKDGDNGFLVQQSAAEIADKIRWVLDNPDAARQMGARGKELVERRFNWDRGVEQLERYWSGFVNPGDGSS